MAKGEKTQNKFEVDWQPCDTGERVLSPAGVIGKRREKGEKESR